jgi:MFS family permease
MSHVATRSNLAGRPSFRAWTVACLHATSTALGDRVGRRPMFCVGLVSFTASSAAAGSHTSTSASKQYRVAVPAP